LSVRHYNLLQKVWRLEKELKVYCLVFLLWIESWNTVLVKPLSYIVAYYMFDKSAKKKMFLWICCLIELWITRIVKCCTRFLGNNIWTFHFITCAIWYTCQSRNNERGDELAKDKSLDGPVRDKLVRGEGPANLRCMKNIWHKFMSMKNIWHKFTSHEKHIT